MNNLIKKENTRPQSNLVSPFDQIFQNNLSRFFDDSFWGFDGNVNRTQVPVNIRETDKSYEMELIAPGLKKQDFSLNIAGDVLTVAFDHKEENNHENKNNGWIRKEYSRQSFSRSFNLDDTMDAAKIEAKYEDGLLRLNIPKKENAQKLSRTINVQ